MRLAYIKFLTEIDRVKGFDVLAPVTPIFAIENDVYCVNVESLSKLEDAELCYTMASHDDIGDSGHHTWHFAFSKARATH